MRWNEITSPHHFENIDEDWKDTIKKGVSALLLGGVLTAVPAGYSAASPTCNLEPQNKRIVCVTPNGVPFWVGTHDRNGRKIPPEQLKQNLAYWYGRAETQVQSRPNPPINPACMTAGGIASGMCDSPDPRVQMLNRNRFKQDMSDAFKDALQWDRTVNRRY